MDTVPLNTLTHYCLYTKHFVLFQSLCNCRHSQCFYRRALNHYFISSMLRFRMLISEPEVTSYRLENAKRTALANSMSVSLTLLHCMLLAEQAGRQPHTDAHYCQFQWFQRFQQWILDITTKRGVWIKVETK